MLQIEALIGTFWDCMPLVKMHHMTKYPSAKPRDIPQFSNLASNMENSAHRIQFYMTNIERGMCDCKLDTVKTIFVSVISSLVPLLTRLNKIMSTYRGTFHIYCLLLIIFIFVIIIHWCYIFCTLKDNLLLLIFSTGQGFSTFH